MHNAFNRQMQSELQQVWRALRRDDDVRCIVLTGASDVSFCTGIDRREAMDQLLEGPDARRPFADADAWHLDDPGTPAARAARASVAMFPIMPLAATASAIAGMMLSAPTIASCTSTVTSAVCSGATSSLRSRAMTPPRSSRRLP